METPNQNRYQNLSELTGVRCLVNKIASQFGYLLIIPAANVFFPRYSVARYTALSVVSRLEKVGLPKSKKQ